MEYTPGEWQEKLSAGERIIYVDTDTGMEVICRDVRHWNTPIVKNAPQTYEALKGLQPTLTSMEKGFLHPVMRNIVNNALKAIAEVERE